MRIHLTRHLRDSGCRALAALVFASCLSPAPGQDGAPAAQPPAASPGQAAVRKAAGANKYLYVYFWRDHGPQMQALWPVFQGAMSQFAGWADWVAVNVNDPAETALVSHFDAGRAPLPLVLAVAPNGAVTGGFPARFDEAQLRQARVSTGAAATLKALQLRRLVLLCVQPGASPGRSDKVPPGVAEFLADSRYGPSTTVVSVDPAAPAEGSFLQKFQIDPQATGSVVVLLAPPGSPVGKFPATVTGEQLAAALASAQSNPCAGGKCGPNGCGK